MLPHKVSHEAVSIQDLVRTGLCVGCGSCVAQSQDVSAKMVFDEYGELKPAGSSTFLSKKSLWMAATCPFSPSAEDEDEIAARIFPAAELQHSSSGKYLSAYVGHAADEAVRLNASSGGMATWLLTQLLISGRIDGVAHVSATNPEATGRFFSYSISRTVEEINAAAKSRYYPIELSQVIKEIREVPGRYAMVGIPCYIKAVNNLMRDDSVLRERIVYTLGLFCGHMKSSRFVESFAWQMEVDPASVKGLDFRYKDPSRPANWYCTDLQLKNGTSVRKDWWHLADGDWGAGYFMNSACNYCDDVVAETADVSFGDAWVEPYSSDGKGTNVVIVRTPELANIVQEAITSEELVMSPVDGEFIEQTQAAGLRQRREGLAYRLSRRTGLMPRKRVSPDSDTIPSRRKLIYRIRYQISRWSHPVFRLARKLNLPWIYIRWARMAAALYHGLAYSRGSIGTLVDKLRLLGSADG